MKTKNIITLIFFSIFTTFLFNGCSEKDISIQKKECVSQDKKFIVKKVLNLRTGEYVLKGECI